MIEGITRRVGVTSYAARITTLLAVLTVALLVSGCLGDKAPTAAPRNSSASTTPVSAPTPTFADVSISQAPDTPRTTSATTLDRPRRGNQAPVGAVVFGSDYTAASKSVSLVGEKTSFAQGQQVAWRVTLAQAVGGESVRVTLTTADGTETVVDDFVAQTGWNVYYGKQLLTIAPGTYVLHYLVSGHEVGSGTFKIKAVPSFVPEASPALEPPMGTPEPS